MLRGTDVEPLNPEPLTATLGSVCARLGLAVVASSLMFLSSGTAAAQSPTPTIVKVGDPCQRRTDTHVGVVKVDACGRWYCGREDIKDIIEVRPDIAEVLNCTWRLEGERCKCRRDTQTKEP